MKRSIWRTVLLLAMALSLFFIVRWGTRAYLARQLAERAFTPAGGSPALTPELTKLDRHAIGPLAESAASTDLTTAQAARDELDRLLRKWNRQDRTQPAYAGDLRRRQLVDALNDRADRFSPSGQRWLASIAQRLLQSGANGPGQHRAHAEYIGECDRLLAAAAMPSDVVDQITPQPATISQPDPAALATAPRPTTQRPATPRPELPPIQWQPRRDAVAQQPEPPIAQSPIPQQLAPQAPRSTDTGESDRIALAEPRPLVPPSSVQTLPLEPPTQPSPARQPPAGDLAWQLPSQAAPNVRGPASAYRPRGVTLDPLRDLPTSLAVMATLPDRPLIQIGLATNDPLARAVLIERGFGGASRSLLARVFAEEESERLRLVEDLLVTRFGGAARLMVVIAGDESPRVRSAAIGALGSSRNPALVEAAWRLAIYDPDPRVAAQAEQLKRRR